VRAGEGLFVGMLEKKTARTVMRGEERRETMTTKKLWEGWGRVWESEEQSIWLAQHREQQAESY
jgi:hypothetical protein